MFCLESFQMIAIGMKKFIILSSVSYRRFYIIHLKKSSFLKDLLFYPKNEVIAFPIVEM